MAFSYQPVTIQQPQIDYTQGMQQQPQQGFNLGGLTQLLGGLQSLQQSRQAPTPQRVPEQGTPGFGIGQELVSPSEQIGQSQYAQQEKPAMGGDFMSALQSIMLGGAGGIGAIAGGSGSPGAGAISGLASANPLLASLTKGGLSGVLGNTIGGKLGGLF